MPELVQHIAMNLHDGRLDGETLTASSHEDGIPEVRCLSLTFRVNAHQSELLPDLVKHDINTEVHVDRNAAIEWVLHHDVDLFDADSVNLVVDIDTLDVVTVALNRVDQVTYVIVATELDMHVVNFVLVHYTLYHAIVNLGQGHVGRENNAASFLRLDHDVWLRLV